MDNLPGRRYRPVHALRLCGAEAAESQLPNPIEEYETLEDAQAAAGFEIPTPAGLPEGYALEAVTTIAKNTIQLIYTDGQNDPEATAR